MYIAKVVTCILKNLSCDILIESAQKAMSIIQIIIEELNYTILKDDIAKINIEVAFLNRSYYLRESRIAFKSSVKELYRALKDTICYGAINNNLKSDLSPSLFRREKKQKGCVLDTIIASNSYRRSLSINIKCDLRVSVKHSLQLINISGPRSCNLESYIIHFFLFSYA